jgi:hypothetical protein
VSKETITFNREIDVQGSFSYNIKFIFHTTCQNLSSLFLFLFSVITLKYFLNKNFFNIFFFEDILISIDASVRICNDGVYLAKCYLESRSFSLIGYRLRRDDTGLFPIAQCRSLDIPVDAYYNRLECKSLAFIAIYKSIFVQEFASAMYEYCYQLTGTTLIPRWSQTDC